MTDHFIAWWNVENLFDHARAPERPGYLAKELKRELEGWTAAVRDRKIAQLARVITQLNDGRGPDILGVCEVENERVMRLLVDALGGLGRNYDVIHHDMSDARGIDVGFIYDADRYTPDAERPWFSMEVVKRSATRDLFQVNLDTSAGNRLILIGNHWPARLGPAEYRAIAGETLSYWMERIQDIVGEDAAVLVMGDFNDEPADRSLTEFALSTRSTARTLGGRNPYLFNLMWPLLGKNKTSYVYNNTPNMLDQFLVSKGMLKRDTPIRVLRDSVDVVQLPEMQVGKYKKPKRFGRPSKSGFNPDGFSDHYPIVVSLREQD